MPPRLKCAALTNEVTRALATCLVERGYEDGEVYLAVTQFCSRRGTGEDLLWETVIGPFIDELAAILDLDEE